MFEFIKGVFLMVFCGFHVFLCYVILKVLGFFST